MSPDPRTPPDACERAFARWCAEQDMIEDIDAPHGEAFCAGWIAGRDECPAGAECALNNGAVHCFHCRRNWPRDETWDLPFLQRPDLRRENTEALHGLLDKAEAGRRQDKARIKWLEGEERGWRTGTLEQTKRLGECNAARRQDKERIERLETALTWIGEFAAANNKHGIVHTGFTHIERRVRAALAGEEDTPNG